MVPCTFFGIGPVVQKKCLTLVMGRADMWMVVYGVGFLTAALMCGIQRCVAETPMKRWEAWLAALAWPVWFAAAWVTVIVLTVSVVAVLAWRWYRSAMERVLGGAA